MTHVTSCYFLAAESERAYKSTELLQVCLLHDHSTPAAQTHAGINTLETFCRTCGSD